MTTDQHSPSGPPPETPPSGGGPDAAPLGSLAQSARSKQLKMAFGILLVVGILTTALNGFLFMTAESQVDAAIKTELKKLPPGTVADPDKVAELREQEIRTMRLLHGGLLAIGIVFIVLALNVKRHPVVITVLGLVLYIGIHAVSGFFNPAALAQGLLIKALIVIALVKSIQSAVAYERERRKQEGQEAPSAA